MVFKKLVHLVGNNGVEFIVARVMLPPANGICNHFCGGDPTHKHSNAINFTPFLGKVVKWNCIGVPYPRFLKVIKGYLVVHINVDSLVRFC